jgi:hypothetical protein
VISKPDDLSVIVNGVQPVGSTWTAEAPYYYHGTGIKLESERSKDIRGNEIPYPFICLFEPLKSKLNISNEKQIGEDVEAWIVFMTKNNLQWTSDQFHDNAIDAMYALMQRFILECDKANDLLLINDEDQEISIVRHSEFGLIAKTKGAEKAVFQDHLAGVEMENFSLKILKKYTC